MVFHFLQPGNPIVKRRVSAKQVCQALSFFERIGKVEVSRRSVLVPYGTTRLLEFL
jgi:hypothetical protein